MRQSFPVAVLALVFLFSARPRAECLPYNVAREHIGESQCISGKVVRIRESRGVTHFDFCEVAEVCPFNVVVFSHNLRDIGDVRQLQNKIVEIHGTIKEYDGRAEIILQSFRQLSGESAKIPPLPKTYDVERRGRYSAGKFSLPRPAHPKHPKKQVPKLPAEFPDDTEPD